MNHKIGMITQSPLIYTLAKTYALNLKTMISREGSPLLLFYQF